MDRFKVFDELESNVRSYCRVFPTIFERAKGAELFDDQGRRFIDFFCGAGSVNYGHNPQAITDALIEYLRGDGILHALDAHTAAKRDFLADFRDVILAPRGLDHRVQTCGPTGTNAVEAALKLARKATGRRLIVAFSGAYHGMSMGSISVTGNGKLRASAAVSLPDTAFIPFADGPAGPFDSIALLERMIDDPSSGWELPAAVIVETVQMDGGVFVAPPEWLRRLREVTTRHGIVLICDDIQVGCGRAGRFFSFEQAAIVPDLITLSKSIGGNGLPMALLLIRPAIDLWSPGEHTGTFRGNQLAFVAAHVALDHWRDDRLQVAIGEKSRWLEGHLQDRLVRWPNLRRRGIGMAHGIDFSAAGGGQAVARVQRACFERGLIIESCGRHDEVLKLLPPLTIAPGMLEEGAEILWLAIADVLD